MNYHDDSRPSRPPQPIPLNAFALVSGEKVRAKLRPQHREQTAAIRKNFVLAACIGRGRAHAPDGVFVFAQSLSNKLVVSAAWFCERCAEMDDAALLDPPEKSFQDELVAHLAPILRGAQ
jgi:hypothetical protein